MILELGESKAPNNPIYTAAYNGNFDFTNLTLTFDVWKTQQKNLCFIAQKRPG